MKKQEGALSWLWRVSGGDKGKIAVMTLVQMASAGLSILSAWLLRGIIDCAVAKDVQGFFGQAAAFIGLTVGQQALHAVYRYLAESCNSSLENNLKSRLFRVLLEADYGSTSAVHSGEWMSRLTSDTSVIASGMTEIMPQVCGMLVKLLGALGMLLVLLPGAGLLILPGGLALILITWVFRKRLKLLHKSVQEADASLRAFLTERLGAMLVLRAFGKQSVANREAQGKMAEHRRARMRKNAFSNVCNIGFGLVINGAYVLGAVVCGYGILTGTMSYGTFTAVLQLITQVQSPFANLSGFVPRYYAMIASAERLMEAETFALDTPEGGMTTQEAWRLYDRLEKMEFRDVSFTYPGDGEATLEQLDLTIRKGEYVAFTGHSGCGKSTALKLLMTVYPIYSGEKLLCTHDGEMAMTSRHRALFSYVPQGNVLMSGTIRQVVTFGDETVTEEAIWRSLEIACAADFVRQLERGLDTKLAERGTGLSEGQMQRLAIARAVLSDRPVMLLDEATSALDEATEAMVLKNLRTMTDRTVVIVTHRPAALEICDKEVAFG